MHLPLRNDIWLMKWIHTITFLLWIVMMVPLTEAAEGKRVAFVVGIGKYDNLAPDKQLKNAVNDADGVSTKLAEIGYQVTKASDLTRSTFNAKWQNVLDSLTIDDTFVLYFSGHGVQITGQNYLLPRDIPFIEYGRDEQLKREAISLNELFMDLSSGDRPHPKRSIVILDACRDNPLIPSGYPKSISTPRGLAGLTDPDGIFVIYAAASNRTALDRLSPSDTAKYSVFTRTLLSLMGRTDLSVQELSYELKDQVLKLAESVGRDQRPTYYDGLRGRFCLPGCAAKAEKEPVGMKETLTTTVVPPFLPKEITDKVKEDSPPAPQSSDRTQQLAMKQNAPLPQVQPTEKLPSAITGKDGAPMVLVPSGQFMMGSREDMAGDKDELPAHPVYLDAYYIDQYEVTTSRYATFFKETNREVPRYWPGAALDELGRKPVVGVDWNDATEYCSWVGKRLPTEAEWEKAARGTDRRLYPWGNEAPDKTRAHFSKVELYFKYGVFHDVGSFEAGKSPYGLYDMAGNVDEWVADWYDRQYYSKSPSRNPTGPLSGEDRVLRGGAWNFDSVGVRSASRNRNRPTIRIDNIGFRCAQDVPK